jgi:hypothetical protein
VVIDHAGWETSWQNGNGDDHNPFDIVGFGVAFRGFSAEPSGRLAIDNIMIRTAAPGRLVQSVGGVCSIVNQSAGVRQP